MSHALISVEYRAAYFVKNTVKYFYTLILKWPQDAGFRATSTSSVQER